MGFKRLYRISLVFLPLLVVTTFSIFQSLAAAAAPPPHQDHTGHFANLPPVLGAVLPQDWSNQSPLLSPMLASPLSVGQWSNVVNWPIVAIHQIMLPNGNILMWDRQETATEPAYIWNPTTNRFTHVPFEAASLFCSDHLLLSDGRVLIVGGHDTADDHGLAQINMFTPATSKWSFVHSMNVGRWYPSAITLSDGRVLIVGGTYTPNGGSLTVVDIPEIYDPRTNSITQLTNASLNAQYYPQMYLMPSGNRVFMLGADDNQAHILDLNSGTWSTPNGGNQGLGTSSVSYTPGKVMWLGYQGQTQVVDLTLNTPLWTVYPSAFYDRTNDNLVMLPDGNVLAIGGSDDGTNSISSGVLMPEMWSPASHTWSQLTPMQIPRMYHSTAVLLADGRILVAGTGHGAGAPDTFNAQYYSPPYLFKGARPTITSATNVGGVFSIKTPQTSNIQSVVLIGLPRVTHGFDQNQRYVPLNFQKQGSALIKATIPANRNVVPPGYYYLFLVNSAGVPSIAKIVQVR